jgi:hypothetical protein
MKCIYSTADGRLKLEVDGNTETELFQKLSKFQEVFESETKCGVCGCENLKYVVRTVDENNYYELKCTEKNCRARFAFGQHKKGGSLFPKRKDKDGNWIKNNGWEKYSGKKEDGE